jgi:hypothetical protein
MIGLKKLFMKNNILVLKKLNLKLGLLYLIIFFNTTLYVIFSPLKFLMVLLPAIAILFMVMQQLLMNNKIINMPVLFIYVFYGLLSIPLFFLLSSVDYLYSPFIGFINIYLYLILWFFIFNTKYDFNYIFNNSIKLLLFVGFIMAIGALVQYFISPTLFGMIVNDIYAQDLSDKLNINKRAISFISSPQSLSLFLAIVLILGYYNLKNKITKIITLILILFAGILTFSKVFVLVIISYIGVNLLLNISFKNILKIIFFMIILIFTFLNFADSNRAFEIIYILAHLKSHVTFLVWMDFINYDTSLSQFLFGHGIGLISRASQMIGEYQILNGSAESFLLQLYFEIGLIGLLIFLSVYIKSIINFYKIDKYKQYSILLISFLPSLLGTPAFYGLTNNFILAFFLISGLIINKKRKMKQ